MALIEVENLWVHYGQLTAVRGISLSIERGEVFGFIGPNGAGKTSTIKVLATLLRPAYGTALLDGVSIPDKPHRVRPRIGYMPDFFGIYEDLTVTEYLHFFAAAYNVPHRTRKRVISDVLALTDLTEKHKAQVDSLSRGMKQRLALARVLVHDPDLLLLDEPASGLDPRARIEVRELLKELQKMGKTILISSHILNELAHLCSHIGIIEAGEMVAQGSVEQIYAQLQLKRLVHVQITNAQENGLIDRIAAIEHVVSVEQQVDRLAIQLHEDKLPVEELLAQLHQFGAKVRMFQPEAMDMETAFMKLTEGKTA
jgi:ABC-2 type transport system ATP-binding protein